LRPRRNLRWARAERAHCFSGAAASIYFKNSSFQIFSQRGASSAHRIGSIITCFEQGSLKAARRNPAQLAQQLLTFRRQDEIGEQQCGMRMRSGPRNRDRLRAADQRFYHGPVDRSALAF
jgi:hypothetical protein